MTHEYYSRVLCTIITHKNNPEAYATHATYHNRIYLSMFAH